MRSLSFTRAMSQADRLACQFGECRDNERNSQSVFQRVITAHSGKESGEMERFRPPMGWNSWDCYGAAVTEEIVRKNAAYMAGRLRRYGWEYIVVDIQWYEPNARTHEYNAFAPLCMDEYSRLIPAPNRFPSSAEGRGFGPLADYVHSLGLKFGVHMMRGIPRQAVHRNTPILGSSASARDIAKTASICAWNTDMYGVDPSKEGAGAYYASVFALYASWGVDFVKCDDIARELPREETELVMLSEALRNCGREMILSLSPGPALLEKAELYKQTADMWRITDDFWDDWELLYAMFERCEKWSIHNGAGHWADADMLPVGAVRQDYDAEDATHFTVEEQKTMMTLWCIFRSPLMIGAELTKLDRFTEGLLTNERILAMHAKARHAHQVWRRKAAGTELVLWAAACADGGQYFALFNIGESSCGYTLALSDLETDGEAQLTELWSGEELSADGTLTAALERHGCRAYHMRTEEGRK